MLSIEKGHLLSRGLGDCGPLTSWGVEPNSFLVHLHQPLSLTHSLHVMASSEDQGCLEFFRSAFGQCLTLGMYWGTMVEHTSLLPLCRGCGSFISFLLHLFTPTSHNSHPPLPVSLFHSFQEISSLTSKDLPQLTVQFWTTDSLLHNTPQDTH